VKAVSLRSLNRQRANIIFSHLLEQDRVLTPHEVSAQEWIFEWDGVLRDVQRTILGRCNIGVGVEQLLTSVAGRRSDGKTGSFHMQADTLASVVELFREQEYMLWFDVQPLSVSIVLKKGATPEGQLHAWMCALRLAYRHAEHRAVSSVPAVPREPGSQSGKYSIVAATLREVSDTFAEHKQRLEAAGWDLSVAALETHSGIRAFCRSDSDLLTKADD